MEIELQKHHQEYNVDRFLRIIEKNTSLEINASKSKKGAIKNFRDIVFL